MTCMICGALTRWSRRVLYNTTEDQAFIAFVQTLYFSKKNNVETECQSEKVKPNSTTKELARGTDLVDFVDSTERGNHHFLQSHQIHDRAHSTFTTGSVEVYVELKE